MTTTPNAGYQEAVCWTCKARIARTGPGQPWQLASDDPDDRAANPCNAKPVPHVPDPLHRAVP